MFQSVGGHHVAREVIILLFLLPIFYFFYVLSFIVIFARMNRIIRAILATIILALAIYISINANLEFFVFFLSAIVFPLIIRFCQSETKKYFGSRHKLASLFSYILLPLFCTFFWPTYLIIVPGVTKYLENRPSSECKKNGRLVELSKDAILRIYPNSKYSPFWVIEGYNSANVSERKFCEKFSNDAAHKIDKISDIRIDSSDICLHPISKALTAYCNNIKNENLQFNNLDIDFFRTNKNSSDDSSFKIFQENLEYAKSKENCDYCYNKFIESNQFDNNIVLYRFKNNNILIVPQPNWLPIQSEPLVIKCSIDKDLGCHYIYEYKGDFKVSLHYEFISHDNKANYGEEPIYNQEFIDKYLEGAQKAALVVEDFIESLSDKQDMVD